MKLIRVSLLLMLDKIVSVTPVVTASASLLKSFDSVTLTNSLSRKH